MKTLVFGFLAALSAFASSAIAADAPHDQCGLPPVQYIGELQAILSQRAVQAVNLAAASGGKPTAALEGLVDPTASFVSGGGDVRVPLASGVAGAIALARAMNADMFRYLGWDYIPTPVNNVCGKRSVEVEFIDTHSKTAFRVSFSFEKGRVTAAEGWRRSYQSGPITPVRP